MAELREFAIIIAQTGGLLLAAAPRVMGKRDVAGVGPEARHAYGGVRKQAAHISEVVPHVRLGRPAPPEPCPRAEGEESLKQGLEGPEEDDFQERHAKLGGIRAKASLVLRPLETGQSAMATEIAEEAMGRGKEGQERANQNRKQREIIELVPFVIPTQLPPPRRHKNTHPRKTNERSVSWLLTKKGSWKKPWGK